MAIADRKRCARCGRRFRKGGTYYTVKAELISVFDGHINDRAADFEKKLGEIEKELKDTPEKELEEQVYKKIEYLVCVACRDEIDEFLKAEDNR